MRVGRLRALALSVALVLAGSINVPASALQTERVPEAAVVNGAPQGMFVGRSLLSGRAVCLLFLSGGRITCAIPEDGLENFDWNRHRAAHGPDSGTWQLRSGQLVVTWGDGGVHQGPITVHPDGIEFYGKRYAKPVAVNVAALAGRWEASQGTTIAGGAGMNRASELTITADGRYQWASTTGGVVAGRAVANDRTLSGSVSVRGLTIVFTSDAGASTSHTLLPAAGQPVNAFNVDSDMFTRSGPAVMNPPRPAPGAAAAPDVRQPVSSASYQGVSLTLPSGWTSGTQQGRFVLMPSNMAPDAIVMTVVYGAERLSGSIDDWLRIKMSADLAGGFKVLQSAPPTHAKSGSLDVLSAGRTVQDPRGGAMLQLYYAFTDGQQAGLAMTMTANEAALKTQMPTVQKLLQSLRFGAANATPSSGASTKTTLRAADLVGVWSHADAGHTQYQSSSGGNAGSSTIAYGDGYTFKGLGTYTYNFTGMYNSVYLKESDSGTWALEGGRLVVRGRTRGAKTYQIIQFQTGLDGGTSMTLLSSDYPPTDSNINVWGEKYARKRD